MKVIIHDIKRRGDEVLVPIAMKKNTEILDCDWSERGGLRLICLEPEQDDAERETRTFTIIREGEIIPDKKHMEYLGNRSADDQLLFEIVNMDNLT